MKVFITGGTGFVGQEILRQFYAAGHQARLLVRNRNSPVVTEIVGKYPVEIWEGDVLNAASVPRAIQGTDAVIHLVGIINEIGEQTFENVHVRATQNVIRACVIAGVKRLIHMSALGARPDAVARYHQTKWAAEQAVSESVLDWTIFRPSLIYGRQDQFVNVFARMAEWSPVLPVFANKRAVFQPVAVEDVARCFVGAPGEARSVRRKFDICGPERLTLAGMLRTILTVTGRKCLIVHIPNGLAKSLAWTMEIVYPKFYHKLPPLNRDQLLMLQEDNVGDNEAAAKLFKLEASSFASGIVRYLTTKR